MSLNRLRRILPLTVCFQIFCCGSSLAASTERMLLTPDLMQTDKKANLPYKGAPYCGPVAVSNSMIWLAQKGFPRLCLPNKPTPKEQGTLAAKLAIYMKTTRSQGTTVNGLLDGINSYVTSCGYKIDSLKYSGWQNCKAKYFSGIKYPDPQTLEAELTDKSCIWLKVGWYRFIPGKNQYKRFAGHWLTLVDVHRNSNNKIEIIVHDSAQRSGKAKCQEKVTFRKLKSGTIITGWKPPFEAKNLYSLGKDLKIKRGASQGLLDGVVVLKMP